MSDLKGKRIWIIDDDLPSEHIDEGGELGFLTQIRPLDQTGIWMLSKLDQELWNGADSVRSLVAQLAASGGETMGFMDPVAAVSYLKNGGVVPDIVVFDLKYERLRRFEHDEIVEMLATLVADYFLTVQVYTDEEAERASGDIDQLVKRFPRRLLPPKSKSNVDPKALLAELENQMQLSLSAHLGPPIRRAVTHSLESVLVRVGAIRLAKAREIFLLEDPQAVETEEDFAEIITNKLIDSLRNDTELRAAIRKSAKNGENSSINAFVESLTSQLKRNLLFGGGILGALRKCHKWCLGKKEEKAGFLKTSDDDEDEMDVREFMSFRLYDEGKTPCVLTGDIVALSWKGSKGPPDLAMVFSAACDLPKFWAKTRGCLSLVRIFDLETAVSMSASAAAQNLKKKASSITASDGLVWLPSVPLDGNLRDCVLFPHFVMHLHLPDPSTKSDARTSTPLFYDDLTRIENLNSCTRLVRVSEPFLTGVLGKISDVLTRGGVPDFPPMESKRIESFVKSLKTQKD